MGTTRSFLKGVHISKTKNKNTATLKSWSVNVTLIFPVSPVLKLTCESIHVPTNKAMLIYVS